MEEDEFSTFFLGTPKFPGFNMLRFLSSVFIRDQSFSIFIPVMSAGVVGLTVTYAKMLTGGFQWCVRQSAEVENLVCRPLPTWLSLCQW